MREEGYFFGEWVVYENRGSVLPLGRFKDGIGFAISQFEQVFSIRDGYLHAPDGTELGVLTGLDESWVVDLGNFHTGHILRQV